jgi:hypothetical protein
MCIALCVLNPQKTSFKVQPPPKNKSNLQLKEQNSLLGLHALAAPLGLSQISKHFPFASLAYKKGSTFSTPSLAF